MKLRRHIALTLRRLAAFVWPPPYARQFEHDCEDCIFLGTWEHRDLYYCPNRRPLPTLIARSGDEPYNYTSGMAFGEVPLTEVSTSNPLRVAWLIANDLGLLKDGADQ